MSGDGPLNKEWLDKNGSEWCAGRIDVREHVDLSMYTDDQLDEMTDDDYYNLYQLGPYGTEVGVPTMRAASWEGLREWLRGVETNYVWTLDQLVEEYEKTNEKIEWFKKGG